MLRGWKVSLAVASIVALAGCAGLDYNEAKTLKPSGSAFDQALYKEYIAESKSEYEQGNYRSSDKWAGDATMAAKGQTPKPTQVSDWHLPSAVVPEMTTARTRLQAALDKGGGTAAPTEMAKAQVGWDCWCEQQRVEENFQPDDIAACRSRYYDNIAKVEAALAPKPAPAPAPKAMAPKDYLVFFDWNKSTLTPEAKKIIADAVAHAKASGAKMVKVVGYTDRSGTPQYNLGLSVRRAEAVEAEMAKLGVPPSAVKVEGKGEEDPLVPTADGVREPQNRRAAISFPSMGASLDPANDNREYVYIGIVQ
ncbi:MAG: OmpA family protein [Rhodospirillales bacterium]|nr:OmpA family protein [Rhodospirillales bacterium]